MGNAERCTPWADWGFWGDVDWSSTLSASELNQAASEIARQMDGMADIIEDRAGSITACAEPYSDIPRPDYRNIRRTYRAFRQAAAQLRRWGFPSTVHPNQLRTFLAKWAEGNAALDGYSGGGGKLTLGNIAGCLCATNPDIGSGTAGRLAAGMREDMENVLARDNPGATEGPVGWNCRTLGIARLWGFAPIQAMRTSWNIVIPTEDNPQGGGGWKWTRVGSSWLIDNKLSDYVSTGIQSILPTSGSSASPPSSSSSSSSQPPGPIAEEEGEESDTILGLEKNIFIAIAASAGGILLLGILAGATRKRKRRASSPPRSEYYELG